MQKNVHKEEIIVYSAGIGEDISFDQAIMTEFNNCKIFAFDPTPKSINWIKKINLPANFIFSTFGISNKTEESRMYLPKNKNHVSGSIYELEHTSKDNSIIVQMKTLKDIVEENNHKYIDILRACP